MSIANANITTRSDRRFHAQPNACPCCGPQLQLWDSAGQVIASKEEALCQAVESVRAGKIIALKGLGGFQLIVDAANERSVVQLRERKHREEKPFAVMAPSLATAHDLCRISELDERLLLSPESPIVLLERKNNARLAPSIAPGNPNLGVMLPYTPLHHLLLQSLGVPVVATSGNLSDEPICIDEQEALERLRGIADVFLVHDRAIVRHMDDSIARIMAGREIVLRRARGYAPLPVQLTQPVPSVLALGAHLKNTVALSVGSNVFVSQHIGDLETEQAYTAFVRSAADLPQLYEPGSMLSLATCIPITCRRNTLHNFPFPFVTCSIIGRTSSRAWRRMNLARRYLVFRGMGLVTAATARFGAENFCGLTQTDSTASDICGSFDCLVARRRSKNRAAAPSVFFTKSSATNFGVIIIYSPRSIAASSH